MATSHRWCTPGSADPRAASDEDDEEQEVVVDGRRLPRAIWSDNGGCRLGRRPGGMNQIATCRADVERLSHRRRSQASSAQIAPPLAGDASAGLGPASSSYRQCSHGASVRNLPAMLQQGAEKCSAVTSPQWRELSIISTIVEMGPLIPGMGICYLAWPPPFRGFPPCPWGFHVRADRTKM
jgi:hypothetical protein